jgi:hypothetical protein
VLVTVHVPPLAARMRVLALLVAGVVVQGVAAYALDWYRVDLGDGPVGVGLFGLVDDRLLTPGGAAYWAAMGAFALFGLNAFARAIVLAMALVQGHPPIRRGLFDADTPTPWSRLNTRFRVAWLTPARAYAHLGVYLVAAIALVATVPTLHVRGAPEVVVPALARGYGGFVMLAGVAAMIAAVAWIARDDSLGAVQGWSAPPSVEAEPSAPQPAPAAPAQRPLIKSPLPSPPAAVDAAPFRAPAGAAPLEHLLVRPDAAQPARTTPIVEDASQAQPKLLR